MSQAPRNVSPESQQSAASSGLIGRFADLFKSLRNELLNPLDPLFVRLGMGVFAVISGWLLWNLVIYRHIWPHRYVIAAGSKSGESYILSQALADVVRRRSCGQFLFDPCNVELEVKETDGTVANLEALEKYQVDLVTAQADTFFDRLITSPNSPAQMVAVLYQDAFQLLTDDPKIKTFADFVNQLSDLKQQEVIDAPLAGGQRESFNTLAKHFNLIEGQHYCVRDMRQQPPAEDPTKPCKDRTAKYEDFVFRVRILGNQDVAKRLQSGWRLLSIPAALNQAIQLKHTTLLETEIPEGAYQGDYLGQGLDPLPGEKLETIAVNRLLLARKDLPEWLTQEISIVLNQHSQDLIDALTQKMTAEPLKKEYFQSYVIPLIPKIPTLNASANLTSTGVSLHPGAREFYQPSESLFNLFNNYADGIGLGISALSLVASVLWGLNLWLKQERKDTADRFIQEVAFLMGFDLDSQIDQTQVNLAEFKGKLQAKFHHYSQDLREIQNQLTQLPPAQESLDQNLIQALMAWLSRADRLNELFEEVRRSLAEEQISQESFRTFNEAYKSARELIGNKVEEQQRTIASFYVKQAMNLLPNPSLADLDQIRNQAAKILVQDNVFSRESFRTFLDAYTLVRSQCI